MEKTTGKKVPETDIKDVFTGLSITPNKVITLTFDRGVEYEGEFAGPAKYTIQDEDMNSTKKKAVLDAVETLFNSIEVE